MKMRVETKVNIDFPKIDFRNNLKHIAKKIVIPLIRNGILTNNSITGSRFPQLDSATTKRKGHSRPLQETLKLYNSFKYKSERKSVVVYIDNVRNDIARYLQIDGIGRSKKKFKFFGVTEGMELDAMSYMRKIINKWVRNANR